MFLFTVLYYCINLFKELQQVTEFSPAGTLLPQAFAVNLTLIRSFIPLSRTDGRLRALKYLGSPGRPEEWFSMVCTPSQVQPSIPVLPFEAGCAGPAWMPFLLPVVCCRLLLALEAPHCPSFSWDGGNFFLCGV